MINWDLIVEKLMETRSHNPGTFRVGIYSRMSMTEGQESVAQTHVKWMKMAVQRDPRFQIAKVCQDFGVTTKDYKKMLGLRELLDDCVKGDIDVVMAFDLSRLGRSYDELMANVAPISQLETEVGVLILHDKLFLLGSQACEWAEKMARGDYSSCRLPYFVDAMPLPRGHS